LENQKPFKYIWKDYWESGFGPAPTSRHVLGALCDFMDNDGGNCFPSQETLAKKTGLHLNSVKKHIKLLVKSGWIKSTAKGYSDKKHRRNKYQARIPKYVVKKLGSNYQAPGRRLVDVE
jgi:DNA-binding MarR family transcriptional regulator